MNNYFINIPKTLYLKPSKNYKSKINKKNDISNGINISI